MQHKKLRIICNPNNLNSSKKTELKESMGKFMIIHQNITEHDNTSFPFIKEIIFYPLVKTGSFYRFLFIWSVDICISDFKSCFLTNQCGFCQKVNIDAFVCWFCSYNLYFIRNVIQN